MRLQSPPLFWRTLLLIVGLSVASLAAWVPTVRLVERVPRAHRVAEQVISYVDSTRIALVYSDPARRRELLRDLLENESLRVVPLEPGDRVRDMDDSAVLRLVQQEVRQRLGIGTRLASEVNGVPGFWVSFAIDEDAYWVFIDRDLLRQDIGRGWIASAALATALSLLVAIAITRVVNRPLAELSRAAADLGSGRLPAPLPDAGPAEIRNVNRNFNRMVSDLEKLNQDRAILLAGVSHDLRTPLTRMRLELEMSGLPEAARDAMVGDLDQMEVIVRQFLDYAVPAPQRAAEPIDLSALVREALARNRLASAESADAAAPVQRLSAHIEDGVRVAGFRPELARVLDNLLGNAQRYGRDRDGELDLDVSLRRDREVALLSVADHGPGIEPAELTRLIRPFERGDASRSGTAGAGLGLAIVERVVRLHHAQIDYTRNSPSGLRVVVRLPLAPPPLAPVAQTVAAG